jgi:tRNA nucleotidyltransferase (CCA-adding enzyme)
MNGGIKMSPKSTRKFLVKLEKAGLDYKDWIALREADRASNLAKGPYEPKQIRNLHRKFRHELEPEELGRSASPVKMKDLAISGRTVQELLGIGPSQIVGIILQHLFDRVINDPTLNTPEKLTEIIIGKKKKEK